MTVFAELALSIRSSRRHPSCRHCEKQAKAESNLILAGPSLRKSSGTGLAIPDS
jgi:hypothetical protein